MPRNPSKSVLQRQHRVGELLRHGLVDALAPMEFANGAVTGGAVTISQVRVSTDLKQARAFVFPLGGSNAAQLIEELNAAAPRIQGPLARRAGLRFTPRLEFVLDNTFDEADRIETLLARANAKSRPT
ncbi:MAG: 30S ribosome-binding factor RbfA [Alphaproteobacteria bacterium]|jgi:ribosome-binding factor A